MSKKVRERSCFDGALSLLLFLSLHFGLLIPFFYFSFNSFLFFCSKIR